MFDEQDYYSDDQEQNLHIARHTPAKKVLLPNSGNDFNHLTGESQSLIKMMQQRGLDVNESEARKLKAHNSSKQKQSSKPKQKAGFFDGGASATFEELLKALNKALSSADPQQASAILTHILDKKSITQNDRNKFGIMKCKILFGLGAYKDCLSIAESLQQKSRKNNLVAATLSNYLAKSKGQLNMALQGYIDFLRAKAHIESIQNNQVKPVVEKQEKGADEFEDSQIDTLAREIDHTEMEYNIKMSKYKNSTNLVFPYYQQFRHRQVLQVSCGDYHTLFLVAGSLSQINSPCQVFGVGQNTVGQILGKSSKEIIKEPILLVELSGKQIEGITATRESSLAWDSKGQIYEWGIKQNRNEQINVTYNLKQKILQIEKGYQHYAALTASGKFYTWGNISFKGASIYKQAQPFNQPAQNTVSISCGSNHIISVDTYGDVFVMGSNQHGQLGLQGELHSKTFKKMNTDFIGKIRRVVCIAEATFLITKDQQLYFTGRISHNRIFYDILGEPIEKPRQGQFTGDIRFITSLVGSTGNYYLTNEVGELYHWQVDTSVKFKLERENEKIPQRFVSCTRSNVYKVRSLIVPQLTKVKLQTEDLRSYEDIQFEIQLYDRFGPFANAGFVVAPRCQIFFSTYPIRGDELQKQNQLFLQSYQFSADDSKVLLNQIIESRLASYKLVRSSDEGWKFSLTISSQQSGKFFFYMLIEQKIIYSKELSISVSEKEKELSEKNKREKEIKEQERKRKAEMEKQRLLEEKLRRQSQQEERRRETQKRAEQAYKKYMREQEEIKQQAEEDRKARREMMTGGGFDLSKLRAKNQKVESNLEKSTDFMQKSTESFLPDINLRPNSKRKINIPAKNSMIMTGFQSVKPMQKQASKIQDLGSTGVNLYKVESNKQKQVPKTLISKGADSLSKTGTVGTTGKVLLRRGVSKGKK